MFNLNKNLSYFIFLHEPDFFLLTYNPVTMPTTDTTLTFEELNDAYMTLTLEGSYSANANMTLLLNPKQ